MKFFVFIMGIILLAASCYPCTDDSYTMKNGKAKIENAKAPSQKDKDHNDSCPPFCICTCCSGFSISHALTSINIPEINSSGILSPFLPATTVNISLPVWEPPRI